MKDCGIAPAQWGTPFCPVQLGERNTVHVVAMGDVGTTMVTGLRLLGGDVIARIGIFDVNNENMLRLEQELNQIRYLGGEPALPEVVCLSEGELFSCDVLIFCASKGVPPVGSADTDVRMAQLEANRQIVEYYGDLAREAKFQGLVAVVSDPVDPLCKVFLESGCLKPWQVQGYGLGVMDARAAYFAERESRFASYLEHGRVYGPHGQDLVVANSIAQYDDDLSRKLTRLTVDANRMVRSLGYKPYIAPALSSAALSILLTLRGDWHYGSLYFGNEGDGAFLGIRNRMTESGPVFEDALLEETLYLRIRQAYEALRALR